MNSHRHFDFLHPRAGNSTEKRFDADWPLRPCIEPLTRLPYDARTKCEDLAGGNGGR